MPHAVKSWVTLRASAGKDVGVQPVVEGEIFGDAAEQAHGGVAVAIDQAGHYDRAAGIDDFCRLVFRFDFSAWADCYYRIGANGYGAVVEDEALGVHGDYCAAGY